MAVPITALPPVAFSDIAKPQNNLLGKDFYHTSKAVLEVKSKAPNGVNFTVKGTNPHEGDITGNIEGKYTDKPTGLTLTQTWNTKNNLNTKVELENNIADGLKAEINTNFIPATKAYDGSMNVIFKQPNFHARAFVNPFKGPTATIDAVVGHEGFLVGAETGYDVQKAAITKYSLAAGYSMPSYAAAITASNNLSIFSASYYHKVSPQVEAAAKATWDSKTGNNVALELASKYQIDTTSFAKAKINDRGIAALAYNVKLSTAVTLGLGASFDTQNMNQAAHKVGAQFTFDS